jgi:hypothetical protein
MPMLAHAHAGIASNGAIMYPVKKSGKHSFIFLDVVGMI